MGNIAEVLTATRREERKQIKYWTVQHKAASTRKELLKGMKTEIRMTILISH
jgi:hypothetical protein